MRVTLQPSGAVLEIQPGERILDGARRLGYDCPQSCRNGNCHVCAALLVEGRVEQAGKVHDHGEFYTCIAEPLEDCVLLWDGVLALGELPVQTCWPGDVGPLITWGLTVTKGPNKERQNLGIYRQQAVSYTHLTLPTICSV